jgi:GNAT superfamily N-acetyltransferase
MDDVSGSVSYLPEDQDHVANAMRVANEPTMQAYEPTIKERIANYFMGDERPSPERRQFANGLSDLAGFIPGLGNVMAGQEAYRAGDTKGMALAAIPLLGASKEAAIANAMRAAERGASGLPERLAAKYPRVDFHVSEGRGPLVVNKVVVPPDMRGQGVGTQFMHDVLAHADAAGKPVALSPSSDFGGNKARLVDWYRSMGFVPNKGRVADLSISESMFRPAQAPAEQPGIIAYHGSPHSFDKFDMSKIGTGEGAQAYGHGLYFADNEAVAKAYRDQLAGLPSTEESGHVFSSLPWSSRNTEKLAREHMGNAIQSGLTGDEAVRAAVASLSHEGNMASASHIRQPYYDAANAIGGLIGKDWSVNPGSMYQVRINADPEHFLDWDKPLSEQPHVADALKRAGALKDDGSLSFMYNETPSRGGEMYERLTSPLASRITGGDGMSAASNALREAGVPGLKYLDQGSRGAGDGSRNYVVFSPEIIDILKKYARGGLIDPVHGAMRLAANH